MTRYLRLYLHFLRFSLSRAMAFRFDFFFKFFMDLAWYATQVGFYLALFRHTPTLGGWTRDQALIFVAGFLCVDSLYMTLFSHNSFLFPTLVNRGDLDYYLVRPVSSLFFMTLREFSANSLMNLTAGMGVMTWALLRYPEPLGAERVALFAGLILNGGLLFAIIHFLFLVPVFWLHSDRALSEIFWAGTSLTNRPHRIFPGWLGRLLLTALPFSVMASFPAQILFEGPSWQTLLHVLAVTGGAFLFLCWLWRQGLRAYGSASS